MNFNEFLNAIIPYVIAIVGIYLLYRPLKEPINALGRGIKSLFGWIFGMFGFGKEEEEPASNMFKETPYILEYE